MERCLVAALSKFGSMSIVWMRFILVPRIAVSTWMIEKIITLEDRMLGNHPAIFLLHKRPQEVRGDAAVIKLA